MNSITLLRARLGLTQQLLAEKGGTSQATIAHYESGSKSPSLSTLERLARSFGLEAVVNYVPPLTREDHRSLAYHQAIAARVKDRPEPTIKRAKLNLKKMKKKNPGASALFGLWQNWLDLPEDDLISRILDSSVLARDMRQVSPFAGTLSPKERVKILKDFRKAYQKYEAL